MDFFAAPTIPSTSIYVFFVIHRLVSGNSKTHSRRKWRHPLTLNILRLFRADRHRRHHHTPRPTVDEADGAQSGQPLHRFPAKRFLIMGRAATSDSTFRAIPHAAKTNSVRLPLRSPN